MTDDALTRARDDSLKGALLDYMHRVGMSCTVGELADRVERPCEPVKHALGQLKHAGRVFEVNGWYRLSDAERQRRVAT